MIKARWLRRGYGRHKGPSKRVGGIIENTESEISDKEEEAYVEDGEEYSISDSV